MIKLHTVARVSLPLLLISISGVMIERARVRSDSAGPAAEVRFAVIGDSGTGQKPQYEVGRQMDLLHKKEGFGFVLMLGDNIYPNGNPRLFKRRFEEPYKALLDDGVKFYASLGNHDVIKGGPGEREYPEFNMQGRNYYSFVQGDGLVQFFALDSTHMNPGQLGWLEDELRKSV